MGDAIKGHLIQGRLFSMAKTHLDSNVFVFFLFFLLTHAIMSNTGTDNHTMLRWKLLHLKWDDLEIKKNKQKQNKGSF